MSWLFWVGIVLLVLMVLVLVIWFLTARYGRQL